MFNCIKCQKERKPKREVTVQVEMSGSPGRPAKTVQLSESPGPSPSRFSLSGRRKKKKQQQQAAEEAKAATTNTTSSTPKKEKREAENAAATERILLKQQQIADSQTAKKQSFHPLLVNRNPVVTRKADQLDLAKRLPSGIFRRILLLLDFQSRSRLQRVSSMWQKAILEADAMETRPVWLYVIFRKNHPSGHERLTVNVSVDGPIFWGKLVAYVYCCSCHFHEHEKSLITLFKRIASRVERVCMVDNPVQYPFVPDSFFEYMADHFSKLQFVYLRDLDLESLSLTTTEKFASHATLKKFVTHGCRKIDMLKDFRQLPQLLEFEGEIQGLKVFLGDMALDSGEQTTSSLSLTTSTTTTTNQVALPEDETAAGERDIQLSSSSASKRPLSVLTENEPTSSTSISRLSLDAKDSAIENDYTGNSLISEPKAECNGH